MKGSGHTGLTGKIREVLAGGPLRPSEIAQRLGEPREKVLHMLSQLTDRTGGAVRLGDGRYARFGQGPHVSRTVVPMPENALYKPILDALGAGPLTTEQLRERLRMSTHTLANRLQRLQMAMLIRSAGRQPAERTKGHVMIWALTQPAERRAEPDGSFRVAGRITVGRGLKWGARIGGSLA